MTRRRNLAALVGLGIPAWVAGAWACGARTAVGLAEDIGHDAAGRDATDAIVDVPVTDGGGDVGSPDQGPDSTEVDAPPDGPWCSRPSCAPGGPGMTNCGAGTACCCASLEVTGGSYFRTYRDHGGSMFTEDPATVSGFRLDEYEVTVGRFRQFVAAWNSVGGWRPAPSSGKHAHLNGDNGLANSASPGSFEAGWLASDDGLVSLTDTNLTCGGTTPGATWTSAAGSQENMPMTCVNWYEAYAFCIWDGGFLPSEAEWGYGAAGGSEQRKFPWGGTPPGGESHYAIYGCYYPDAGFCTYDAGYIIRPGTTAPVGTPTLGGARWGQLDLAGNVWEWTLDVPAAFVNPCTDCAYLAVTPDARMFRGGAWFNTTTEIMSSFRDYIDPQPPMARTTAIGVRCARSP